MNEKARQHASRSSTKTLKCPKSTVKESLLNYLWKLCISPTNKDIEKSSTSRSRSRRAEYFLTWKYMNRTRIGRDIVAPSLLSETPVLVCSFMQRMEKQELMLNFEWINFIIISWYIWWLIKQRVQAVCAPHWTRESSCRTWCTYVT